MTDRLLDANEVAERLHVPVSRVRDRGRRSVVGCHRSMSTTKQYVNLAGVVFRDEAAALEQRMGSRYRVPVPRSRKRRR